MLDILIPLILIANAAINAAVLWLLFGGKEEGDEIEYLPTNDDVCS